MGKDNILPSYVMIVVFIIIGVTFGIIWKSFEYFKFISFLVLTSILAILYLIFG